MQTVEITAKSVQEATKAAAEKLGVSPERVQVTILEESKGLFGKSSVRVRAEVTAAESEAAPVAAASAPAAPAPTPAPARSRRGSSAAATAAAAPAPTPTETLDEMQAAVDPVAAPSKREGSRRRGGKTAPATEEVAPVAVEAPAPVVEETQEEEVVASQADADHLLGLVQQLVEAASLQVNAKIGQVSGRYVNIVLDGKDAAFLVGKHGEVLNALQYLVNIIAGKKIERGVRATLDCNDYRRRREDALTQLATKIAEQVLERGEEAVLDALPAFERRVVHKALSEIDGVTTYSEGEEPNRRVVIAPAE